jgi:hypothetical protein
MVSWPRAIAGFLLLGYLVWKRPFAYIGVPPLFIGEICLGAFLLLKPRVVLGTWAASLLRPSPLNMLGLTLFIFMAYGVWEAARGVYNGIDLLYTMKFFIFNYYTLFLFLGTWVALHDPEFLPKLIRIIAWVGGIYGLLYIVALRHAGLYMPGTTVPMFAAPGSSPVAILGLLCFVRNLRSPWVIVVLGLNVLVSLVWQVRAEWLGLALALVVWGLLTGQLARVVAIGIAGLALLGAIEFFDLGLVSRTGGAVSLSETLGRFIAPFNLDLAKAINPQAARHVGTAEWRELWWQQIWISARSTPMLEAFGHGYGFNLFGLAPPEVRSGQEDWDVRTPHSVFYFALGYTGWVGVGLFALMQLAIFRLLWRSYRITGQPAGVVLWVALMAMAHFEASFDAPYEAIPFYLLTGLSLAPALQSRDALAPRAAPVHVLSAAGA